MYNPNIHHRKSIRLKDHDYTVGCYFVTIAVHGRMPMFGEVVDGAMALNDAGAMIESMWLDMALRFPNIALDSYIVMPDHFHGIINLGDKYKNSIQLSEVVGSFKSLTTTQYIKGVREQHWLGFEYKLWQRDYFEEIILNHGQLVAKREYIRMNPGNLKESHHMDY